MKKGQVVKFKQSTLDEYKNDITIVGQTIRNMAKQKLVVTDIDEFGSIQLNYGKQWFMMDDFEVA